MKRKTFAILAIAALAYAAAIAASPPAVSDVGHIHFASIESTDVVLFALETASEACLDRFLFIVLGELHAQDHRLQKPFRRFGRLLQHIAAGDENALGDF